MIAATQPSAKSPKNPRDMDAEAIYFWRCHGREFNRRDRLICIFFRRHGFLLLGYGKNVSGWSCI